MGHDNLSGTAGAPKAAGDPVRYYAAAYDTHNVIYRTGDGHLHALYWVGVTPVIYGGNLTWTISAPPAAGDPVAYYTAHNDTHQVVYRGGDGHLYALYWAGVAPVAGWDLTAPSGAPAATGTPAAYYDASTNTKHVIYRSADGGLHELWWVPGGAIPAHVDLTAAYGAPPAADQPAAFTVDGLRSTWRTAALTVTSMRCAGRHGGVAVS